MNKNGYLRAFTVIELMVSIFITMIVIASFYKLYDTASKAERSSAIRVSVNLLGEYMLDTISNSIRFIGLNSNVGDFESYITGISDSATIIREASPFRFRFLSPFGGPITKLAEETTGTYPNCHFKIYSSAALYKGIKSFYIHTSDGIYETSEMNLLNNDGYQMTYGDYRTEFTTAGFEKAPADDLDGNDCKNIFPVGSMISGPDRIFTLSYESNNGLRFFTSTNNNPSNGDDSGNDVFYFKDGDYKMSKFVIHYLVERSSGMEPIWKTEVNDDQRKNITAVRFGFILLSTKDRNKVGTSEDENTYCIFGDGSTNDCDSINLNDTAYVFRRVVHLQNYNLLRNAQSN